MCRLENVLCFNSYQNRLPNIEHTLINLKLTCTYVLMWTKKFKTGVRVCPGTLVWTLCILCTCTTYLDIKKPFWHVLKSEILRSRPQTIISYVT